MVEQTGPPAPTGPQSLHQQRREVESKLLRLMLDRLDNMQADEIQAIAEAIKNIRI